MRIGILGTGSVGQSIGSALVAGGYEVRMGSRGAANPKAQSWADATGTLASHGTFADAAAFADEVIFNCTSGAASLDALRAAGPDALGTKILIDVANPLDFSRGMPPSLIICNTDSLGERIQGAFPDLRVVKALNTMNSDVMVNPALVPGAHNVFVCGNDAEARERVGALLHEWFGWPVTSVLDLGDITAARGTEMYLPLWLRLYATFANPYINVQVARGAPPARRA